MDGAPYGRGSGFRRKVRAQDPLEDGPVERLRRGSEVQVDEGPQSRQDIVLGNPEEPELLWITGYQAVMVGADGETPMAQEFMCHSNLDINPGEHRKSVGSTHGFNPRLFTLSQGQFDVEFPPGFGIPVISTESLALTTQVLNLNLEGEKFKVRHKVSLDYVRDSEADEMTPLFPVGAYGLTLLEGDGGYYGIESPDEEDHGPGCLPGSNASDPRPIATTRAASSPATGWCRRAARSIAPW